MNKYVLIYNDITHGNSLLYPYETIEGKTPLEALKQHFKRDFKRLTGDAGRYSNVILVKGYYDEKSNNIVISGKYQRLCYGLI